GGGDGGGADGVGVELGDLAEAARPRLLVPPHRPHLIAAEGLRQSLVVLGDIAGERRGEVVAERQPLIVVVLEGEHALIWPVLVGEELAERVGIFDGRRIQRLKAVGLEYVLDLGEHVRRRAKLARGRVEKALRQAGLRADRLVFLAHGNSDRCGSWSRLLAHRRKPSKRRWFNESWTRPRRT